MENCIWCIWKTSGKVERLNFVSFSKFPQGCFIKVNEVGEIGLPVLGSYTSLLCSFCESSFGQIKSDKNFSSALVLHILIDAVFFQNFGLIEMHFYLPGTIQSNRKLRVLFTSCYQTNVLGWFFLQKCSFRRIVNIFVQLFSRRLEFSWLSASGKQQGLIALCWRVFFREN